MITKILRIFGLVKQSSITGSRGWHGGMFGSFRNSAKETVNNETALTVSGVYAAIRNISEDVAKLPLKIYRKQGASKFDESNHPVYKLLQYKPNPEMSAMSFRETLNAHAMGWGNGYAFIQRDVFGNPVELWPLRPDRITIKRTDSGDLYYNVLDDNGHTNSIWPQNMLHVNGFGSDGVRGYNLIQFMSECVASGIAMDKFSSAFFGNGLNSQGHLTHPGNLSDEAQGRLKKQMGDEFSSAGQSHKMMVFEEGMAYVKNTIDPKASQMIESRAFSVNEFCRWLRIPPHKVAELSHATFSNIEQQNIDYVTDGLTGWFKRWEQELWIKLLNPAEQKQGFYFEHNAEGLLRGDVATRYTAYSTAWDRGILSINEIRSKENLNPIDGGDQHFVPMNFTPLNQAGMTDSIVADAAQRIYSHAVQNANISKEKYGSEFNNETFLADFKPKHDKYSSQVLKPFGIDSFIAVDSTVDEIIQTIKGALCQK